MKSLLEQSQVRFKRRVTVGHVKTSTPRTSARKGTGQGSTVLPALTRRSSTKDSEVKAAVMAEASSPEDSEASAAAIVTANAPMLARKYRLELFETKTALLEFHKARRNVVGGLDYEDFYDMMCRLFAPTIQDAIVQRIYTQTGMHQRASIERFLEWQMMNMFSETAGLLASPEKAESEKLVYQLAKDFAVGSLDIDHIKRAFDKYDTDKSGLIDFYEFRSMLENMLKAKVSSDLSLDRVKKFWREIDRDGSGQVDFSEFTEWYLKYFKPDFTSEMGSCNLIEAFYASFNPENQRHFHLDDRHAGITQRRNTIA